MIIYEFNKEKNKWLLEERGISFEDVINAINNNNGLLDIQPHPNQVHYSNQEMFIVNIKGYTYIVPFCQKWGKNFSQNSISESQSSSRVSKNPR